MVRPSLPHRKHLSEAEILTLVGNMGRKIFGRGPQVGIIFINNIIYLFFAFIHRWSFGLYKVLIL